MKQILIDNNITMEAVFVPFSQSRNKKESRPSLNWVVTVLKDGRPILSTDYMQGIGHTPYNRGDKKIKFSNGRVDDYAQKIAEKIESETGCAAVHNGFAESIHQSSVKIPPPNIDDVIYSLITDSSVIDYGDFESWAHDFGYSTDSISAEKIYKACIEIAIKLGSKLGAKLMTELVEAYEDY